MSNLMFKKEFFGYVKDLSNLNNSIIINKDNDKIRVNGMNDAENIFYQMNCPNDYFKCDDEITAFYNYKEFNEILNVFQNPTIDIIKDTENNLSKFIISEGKSKIIYVLSDPESFKKGPKKFNFPESVCTLNLQTDELKNLKKMIAILKAKYINFNVKDNIINISVGSEKHHNSYEKEYTLEKATTNANFKFKSDIFMVVPDNNYVLDIGIAKVATPFSVLKLKYVHDIIDLNFYMAESDE